MIRQVFIITVKPYDFEARILASNINNLLGENFYVVHSVTEDNWKDVPYFDILFFGAGGDIDPKEYSVEQAGWNLCVGINEERDKAENNIFFNCRSLSPNLCYSGICRGHQKLAVLLGGSLFFDLDDHNDYYHNVTVESNKSNLFKFIRTDQFTVNSIHHQAISYLPSGLNITLTSDDNRVIEGIESEKLRLRSVQFHPEIMKGAIANKLHAYLLHADKFIPRFFPELVDTYIEAKENESKPE